MKEMQRVNKKIDWDELERKKISSKVGMQVRIILTGNFHYSGKILDETETHYEILDKFGKIVLLKKTDIAVLEVV